MRRLSERLALALFSALTCAALPVCGRTDADVPSVPASGATKGAAADTKDTGKSPPQANGAGAAKAQPADKGWTLFGSLRLRIEDHNFFPTPKGNGAYTFFGDTLRVGVQRQTPKEDYLFELESPGLFNLPTRAVAAAPQGQLGQGGTYYATNRSQVASLFLKQAYVRIKDFSDRSNSLRLGRFEYGDGLETVSTEANLNWIKQNRIAQRMIGSFGYSLVTRSFDGLQYAYSRPNVEVHAAGVFPTRGALDLNGWDSLSDIRVFYLSAAKTRARSSGASDGRLFYIYYEDARSKVVKTDNRPAGIRAADHNAIRIHTFGANYERVMPLGAGKADLTLWAAGQVGEWGLQNHGAYAADAEIGYQFTHTGWKPWLRAVYYLASGDGNPNNSEHGTFFPVLPTARTYVRYPFFSQTNIQDLFASVLAKPCDRLTLRSDLHSLRLADSHDLWYAGAGAYNNSSFGFSGRPSGGTGDLATLVDLSADYQIDRHSSFTLYGAFANGGRVVSTSFTGRDSVFIYGEFNVKL